MKPATLAELESNPWRYLDHVALARLRRLEPGTARRRRAARRELPAALERRSEVTS